MPGAEIYFRSEGEYHPATITSVLPGDVMRADARRVICQLPRGFVRELDFFGCDLFVAAPEVHRLDPSGNLTSLCPPWQKSRALADWAADQLNQEEQRMTPDYDTRWEEARDQCERIPGPPSTHDDVGGIDHPDSLVCLNDNGDGECKGAVEYRMPLSGTGRSFPRCDKHWAERLDEQERINERYPASPPSDWSPLDAGEAWGEDDY